jgi:hypothetical protein
MSSFIVEDKTIHRILSKLYKDKSTEYCDEMGKKLLRMNIDATNQRYPEHPYLTKKEDNNRIRNYKFIWQKITDIQALKSLRCYLYQCGEGNIDKRKLYKELKKTSLEWAYNIVNELKEYEEAEWG